MLCHTRMVGTSNSLVVPPLEALPFLPEDQFRAGSLRAGRQFWEEQLLQDSDSKSELLSWISEGVPVMDYLRCSQAQGQASSSFVGCPPPRREPNRAPLALSGWVSEQLA